MPHKAVPSAICIHDDHWHLGLTIRSFLSAGPVTVFVSKLAWDGSDGCWERVVEAAEKGGAEVVLGEWPDESVHRAAALEEMKSRGHSHIFIPDGDEVISPELLDSCLKVAASGACDTIRVRMDTYWKSPRYVIRPREELAPLILIDAQTSRHVHIREYSHAKPILLGPEHGVLHHLSYAGPDERIMRKVATWGHRNELVPGWVENVWHGWDRDTLMRDIHPTHPPCYGWAERIELPAILEGADDPLPTFDNPEKLVKWPKVSVVIPLYGGPEDIFFCLNSLESCRDLLHEVVVADDVSPDNAPGVAEQFDWVRVIRSDVNRGFGGNCNWAYGHTDGEVVIFLNSDTIVPRAGLIRLVESLMASGTVGAAGPFSNNVGYQQRLNAPYTSVHGIELFARDFAHRDAEDVDVEFIVGFCLAVRRSVIEEVGLFDERFRRGMYEDNDFCYRLQKAGYKCRIAARAFVHHKGTVSLNRAVSDVHALLDENKMRYEWKWFDDVDLGFVNHLPGESPTLLEFNPARSPEAVRKECLKRAKEADISLCMIARNEERVLEACLGSARGFFRQMIVVDTGSTDRTREIAEEAGAEVHDFPWVDSFAAARNESMRHAAGKWIFWMDCDDTLPLKTIEQIQNAALTAPPDVMGFIVPVQFTDRGRDAGTKVDHVKLFRNVPGLTWEGHIHEQILPSMREIGGEIARLGCVVLHSGYDTSPEGQERKRERDFKLLKLDLDARPEHPFVNFNMGMTLHYVGDHAPAVHYLERSIRLAQPHESHVRKAFALLAGSLSRLEQWEQTMRCLDEALATVGDDPELYLMRAEMREQLGDRRGALEDALRIRDLEGAFQSIDMGVVRARRDALVERLR